MKKRYILFLTIFGLVLNISAQTQDNSINNAGDIAFVGWYTNTMDQDGFSFVFLDNCPNATTITFDDQEWDGTAFVSATEEGQIQWENTTGAIIPKGTVVTITNANNTTVLGAAFAINANIGTATEINTGFNLTSLEGLYAYSGTRAAPSTFLAFIGDTAATTTSLSGTNLVADETTLMTTQQGYYLGETICSGSVSDCAKMINNKDNWTFGTMSFPADIKTSFTGATLVTTATAPTAPVVLEDAVAVALADDIEVSDADGDNQTVTFTVAGGTVALGTTGITFGGDGNGSASFTAAGTLVAINTALDAATFTPGLNLNGTDAASISFTTNDGLVTSNTAIVTFDITAVNDEPSFVKGADENVNEDAGTQTVTGWATSIEDGDSEATQILTFTVTNNNNALFSSQPAISATGNLTYTPTADASGVATISVVLSDDGGIPNGGDDTFTTQEFTITVNQVNDTPVVITSISDDNGSSSSDYITNDNTPTVNGTAEPGSTITISINGGPFSGVAGVTATANSQGAFTFPFPAAFGTLPDATATFSAAASLNGVTLTSSAQSVTIDTAAPAPTISSTESNPTVSDPITVNVSWSENVTSFTASDVVVINGTVSNFTGSDDSYIFEIEPTANGEITVNIAEDLFADLAGNNNVAATEFSITYNDTTLSNDLISSDTSIGLENPVKDRLVITGHVNSVTVYSLSGVLVANSQDVSMLRSGIYIAVISTVNGVFIEKIVKE